MLINGPADGKYRGSMSQERKIIPIREGRIRKDIRDLKAQIRKTPKENSGQIGLLGDDPEEVCRELDEVGKRVLQEDYESPKNKN